MFGDSASHILCVLWLFQVEDTQSLGLNLGHKWKSLELYLSRKLFSFCFVFKGKGWLSKHACILRKRLKIFEI